MVARTPLSSSSAMRGVARADIGIGRLHQLAAGRGDAKPLRWPAAYSSGERTSKR